MADSSTQPSHPRRSEPISKPAGLHLKKRLRLSHVWGPAQYRKAKAEPAFRFYLLYDEIYREDILRHAYALARANAGAPGTDQMTFAAIEALGLERWLAGLREELV